MHKPIFKKTPVDPREGLTHKKDLFKLRACFGRRHRPIRKVEAKAAPRDARRDREKWPGRKFRQETSGSSATSRSSDEDSTIAAADRAHGTRVRGDLARPRKLAGSRSRSRKNYLLIRPLTPARVARGWVHPGPSTSAGSPPRSLLSLRGRRRSEPSEWARASFGVGASLRVPAALPVSIPPRRTAPPSWTGDSRVTRSFF